MTARSTVLIDRDLCRRVDAWADRNGFASGPGHRTKAVDALLKIGLTCMEAI